MKKRILAVLAVALSLVACGSSESKPSTVVALQGTLAPAPGLSAADFTVSGPTDDGPSGVSAAGTWTANGLPHRTGILFATPKQGSAAAVSLGPESGLYMTPVADGARLVKSSSGPITSSDAGASHPTAGDGGGLGGGAFDGSVAIDAPPATPASPGAAGYYVVATEGDAAMDATTTVISMLLMHPSLAHPSSDVSVEQLRWITARMASSWPCLGQAAAVYDADLIARLDFSADANFMGPFALCLDDVATMPAVTPPVPTGRQAMQSASTSVWTASAKSPGTRFFDTGNDPVQVSLQRAGIQVASVSQISSDNQGATVAPKTKDGTGLDYYYTVKQVDDALTKAGTSSPMFSSPNQLEVHATTSTLAAGFIPASSYWSYLDVVGNTLKKVSTLVASAVVETPNRNVTLPGGHLYEVRFFSGGFGIGVTADQYTFATTSFSSEHDAALYQNVAMAVVEVIALIPGAGEVLAEGDGGKILQAVVQKVIVDLRALIAAKGSDVTGDDIYNLMYGVIKTALDGVVAVATTDAQAGVAKKLFGWLVGGGKKVIKTVVGLPGKIAKGGTLGNRAFRLSNPESVMEYYLVAVLSAPPPDAGASPPVAGLPVIEQFSGTPGAAMTTAVGGPFDFSVKVSGGKPPYFYAWYGYASPQVLLQGPQYSQISITTDKMRCAGTCNSVPCCCVWVTVTDENGNGEPATWLDSVGMGHSEFAYCIDGSANVYTEPASYPYRSPKP